MYWVDVGYFVLTCRELKVVISIWDFSVHTVWIGLENGSMSRELNILEGAQSKTVDVGYFVLS